MLNRIIETKKSEIEERKKQLPFGKLMDRLPDEPVPSLLEALRSEDGLNIIAEIKYSSPSHGPFKCQGPPVDIARSYLRNGAAALSILTDESYFNGRLEYLSQVYDGLRDLTPCSELEEEYGVPEPVPLLRKDFLIDRYQVAEARNSMASGFLLIAACLDSGRLADLREFGSELGLDALVEVHDAFELETAVESGARLIGVNNRNLKTFEVSIQTSFEIARRLEGEAGYTLVAESGISQRGQMLELRDAGFSALLIGTTFMDTPDPGGKLRELLA